MLPHEIEPLKFIACGAKGITKIAIQEILNVFQVSVWLGVVFIILILSCFMVCVEFSSSKGSSREVFSGLARNALFLSSILLEQGFPLTRKQSEKITRRILIGGIFVTGIILSNAYKSTNVFNMISPRQVIPFRKISELREAGYTIFSITDKLSLLDTPGISKRPDALYWSHLGHQVKNTENSLLIQSQVLQSVISTGLIFALEEYILIASEVEGLIPENANATTDERNSVEALVESSLHPALAPYIRSLVRKIIEIWDDTDGMVDFDIKVQDATMEILKDAENMLLWDELTSCNMSAIILPVTRCHEYAQRLLRRGESLEISVSEDSYFETQVGYTLLGIISPVVLRRFRSAMAASLWERVYKSGQERLNQTIYSGGAKLEKPNRKYCDNIYDSFLRVGIGTSILFTGAGW